MTELALFPDIHLREGHAEAIRTELQATIDSLGDDPDHAFILGDLIEDGADAAVDARHVATLHRLFERAPFPVTYLLGNHDLGNLDRTRLSALLDQAEFFGRRAVDGRSVVFLDSTRGHTATAGGELGPTQRHWLAQTLADRPGDLLLCHHPFGNFDLSDNVWFEAYPERAFLHDRKEALDLVEATSAVRGTISGHVHQTGCNRFRDVAHVSIGPFSKERPDVPVTGTYGHVRISDVIEVDVMVRDSRLARFVME